MQGEPSTPAEPEEEYEKLVRPIAQRWLQAQGVKEWRAARGATILLAGVGPIPNPKPTRGGRQGVRGSCGVLVGDDPVRGAVRQPGRPRGGHGELITLLNHAGIVTRPGTESASSAV
ncbi:hypothetical protein OsI_24785 [Oryza sativa Indica Group]|uniref:Uncharacterized protein n=1 Tax=Oryza sativa subsp. indica TaxID=39946 RepID=B8B723_ORYSI|nr:hypothetical protein OsI_24785 [Oryza sativa Indica Group]